MASTNLCYRADGQLFQTKFKLADWDVLLAIRERRPDEIACLLDAGEEPVTVCKDELLMAVRSVRRLFEAEPELLPRQWQHKLEYLFMKDGEMVGDDSRFRTGITGGVQLPGDADHFYLLETGTNICHLKKMAVQDQNPPHFVEVIDMRDKNELQTTTNGLIKFRVRKPNSVLPDRLHELVDWLRKIESSELEKLFA